MTPEGDFRSPLTGLTRDVDARSSSPSAVPAGSQRTRAGRGHPSAIRWRILQLPYGIVGAVGLESVGSIWMRQRRPHSGAFLDEATRRLTLIDALHPWPYACDSTENLSTVLLIFLVNRDAAPPAVVRVLRPT